MMLLMASCTTGTRRWILVASVPQVGTCRPNWNSPNTGATNSSGFTALPGGYRYLDGSYGAIGLYGYWWSSPEFGSHSAWFRWLYYGDSNVFRNYDGNKHYGFSVRCVRD